MPHPHPTVHLFHLYIAGLGIFTGVDLQEGDAVAEPDIIVPLQDPHWHTPPEEFDFYNLWNDYSWNINEVGLQYDMSDGSALVLGTGCMPNCNFALNNAREGKVRRENS